MALSVAQLIAAAETCGKALRLLRAGRTVTRADLVVRAAGTSSADQSALSERGKRPMLAKQCMAVAHALGLTDDEAAQRLLLARVDRALERLKPLGRLARLGSRWRALEAFLTASLQETLPALIATLDTLAALWPHVTAGARPLQPAAGQARQSPTRHYHA